MWDLVIRERKIMNEKFYLCFVFCFKQVMKLRGEEIVIYILFFFIIVLRN